MRLVISTMGDHVLVVAVGRDSTMLETITPDEARAYARRLIFASAKARQNAVGKYRQPVPEGSTVGEAEGDDDLCPSCPNYVGKCPKCGRPRPSIDEAATMATHDRCPFCSAPMEDDPGRYPSGDVETIWTCGTWRRIDGVTFCSDGCGAREVADAARMRGPEPEAAAGRVES